MSPLFGSRPDGPDGLAAVNTEIDRLGAMPLTELAAELMIKGFGPGGPGGPGQPGSIEAPSLDATRIGLSDLGGMLTPAFTARAAGAEQQLRLGNLIAEALQLLEHAALIRLSWRSGLENYTATRLGRTAVASGTITDYLPAPPAVAT